MSEPRNVKPVTVTKRTKDEDDSTAVARMSIRPVMRAASTLKNYESGFADVELADLVSVLEEQTAAAKSGNSKRAEAMLAAQAHTLDSIFHALAQRAIRAEYLTQLESSLKLALRAQSQSRATWGNAIGYSTPTTGQLRRTGEHHQWSAAGEQ